MLLTSPLLSSHQFRHGFSLRYDAGAELDFALLRQGRNVAEPRLAQALGFSRANLYQAKQVHGTRILTAEGDRAACEREEADGLYARSASPGVAAIRVADCVPILVGDVQTGDAWALHAGWRGVAQNIVHAALEQRDARSLVCAIGPSIGPCCFETGDDVAAQIVAASDKSIVVRTTEKGDLTKVWVDLRRAIQLQLRSLGVEKVDFVGGCTVCEPKKYHSFRRDGDPSGRMIAVIVPHG